MQKDANDGKVTACEQRNKPSKSSQNMGGINRWVRINNSGMRERLAHLLLYRPMRARGVRKGRFYTDDDDADDDYYYCSCYCYCSYTHCVPLLCFSFSSWPLPALLATSACSTDVQHQKHFKQLTVPNSKVQPVLQPWLARPSRGPRAGLAFCVRSARW